MVEVWNTRCEHGALWQGSAVAHAFLSPSDIFATEAHTVPSPSGTRAVFGSDWGNGTSVDSYVLELPSYSP